VGVRGRSWPRVCGGQAKKLMVIIHGWRRDIEETRLCVCDEESFAKHLKAVSYTACGKKIYGMEPCAVGGPEYVTCKNCKRVLGIRRKPWTSLS
jgi:hypothetical protein